MYPCPCCGYKTLNAPANGSHQICPVCFWDDDRIQLENPDYTGGANYISLRQAQKNFLSLGACEKGMKQHVRAPREDEARDEDWKPLG